jgi:hypothetical protein
MPNVALACGLSRKTAKGVRATYDCWCRQRQLSVVPAPPLIIRLSIWARQGGLRWFFSTVKFLSPPGTSCEDSYSWRSTPSRARSVSMRRSTFPQPGGGRGRVTRDPRGPTGRDVRGSCRSNSTGGTSRTWFRPASGKPAGSEVGIVLAQSAVSRQTAAVCRGTRVLSRQPRLPRKCAALRAATRRQQWWQVLRRVQALAT